MNHLKQLFYSYFGLFVDYELGFVFCEGHPYPPDQSKGEVIKSLVENFFFDLKKQTSRARWTVCSCGWLLTVEFALLHKISLTVIKKISKLGISLSFNEPKSRKFVRRAPCAKRRAKLSKQTAPRKSEKKFSRAKNFTDVERRF